MLNKHNRIICDVCGHFIPYQDLADGLATHYCATPDSDRSTETFESLCRTCLTKERASPQSSAKKTTSAAQRRILETVKSGGCYRKYTETGNTMHGAHAATLWTCERNKWICDGRLVGRYCPLELTQAGEAELAVPPADGAGAPWQVEINSALTAYLDAIGRGPGGEVEKRALQQILWDNKAGIAAYLLATPPVRGDRQLLERIKPILEAAAAGKPVMMASVDVLRDVKRFLSLPVQPGAGERWQDIATAPPIVQEFGAGLAGHGGSFVEFGGTLEGSVPFVVKRHWLTGKGDSWLKLPLFDKPKDARQAPHSGDGEGR